MTELNLKCHYQMVRCKTQYGEEFTVHEAFSTDKGELYMICPVPVYVVGESKEEVSELMAMMDKDLDRYPVIDIRYIQPQFDRYIEYTTIPPATEPNYYTENMNPEEELFSDDYHDKEGNVLDLVDFMKNRK